MKFKYLLLCGIAALILNGCASKIPQYYSDRALAPESATSFYHHLDQQIRSDKINTTLGNNIDGFPYLRTNRFLTYLKKQLHSDLQKKQWVTHLQNYDLMARTSEIKSLPGSSVKILAKKLALPGNPSHQDLINLLNQYSNQLKAHDQNNHLYVDTLIKKVTSPDGYSTTLRVMGLYPLVYKLVAYLTRKTYDKLNHRHLTDPEKLPLLGERVQYIPHAFNQRDINLVKNIFATTAKDSLGIRRLNPKDQLNLLNFHAPIYLLDQVDSKDMPGLITLKKKKVSIDTGQPTVYYYFSHAILNKQPVLQINYVVWFSERRGPAVPWYEQGFLDGFTYRVTLGDTGIPMMIDLVHNCGCYHFFVPNKSSVRALKPSAIEFGNQVPSWIPDTFPNERISLMVSSGWHMVDHVGTLNLKTNTRKYKLIPYSDLEVLNIFNAKAIVKGSQRLEPLFLFPMGVPEIGAMRQRTHQPTRLLGKEHFDNPLLLEEYFKFDF